MAEALGGTWFPSLGCLFPGGWVLLLRVHSCFLHRALPTPRHRLPYSRSHKSMLSAETGIWQGVGSNWALSSPGGPTLCSSCSRERSLEDQDKVLFLPLPYPIFLSPQFMSTFSRIFPSVPIYKIRFWWSCSNALGTRRVLRNTCNSRNGSPFSTQARMTPWVCCMEYS